MMTGVPQEFLHAARGGPGRFSAGVTNLDFAIDERPTTEMLPDARRRRVDVEVKEQADRRPRVELHLRDVVLARERVVGPPGERFEGRFVFLFERADIDVPFGVLD